MSTATVTASSRQRAASKIAKPTSRSAIRATTKLDSGLHTHCTACCRAGRVEQSVPLSQRGRQQWMNWPPSSQLRPERRKSTFFQNAKKDGKHGRRSLPPTAAGGAWPTSISARAQRVEKHFATGRQGHECSTTSEELRASPARCFRPGILPGVLPAESPASSAQILPLL